MGLHDRDYMQERPRPGAAASLSGAPAWALLIVVNALVYLAWQAAPPGSAFLADNLMVSATGVLEQGRAWTLLTSAFAHTQFLHLFWNMLFLAVFASELEARYGGKDLVWLYVFGAGAAAGTQVLVNVRWGDPAQDALGASGAVLAVATASVLLAPRRRVDLAVVQVPVWVLAGCYLLLAAVGVIGQLHGARSGIAHAAHLGGALAGAAFKLLDLRLFTPPAGDLRPGFLARLDAWRRGASRPAPAERPAPEPLRASEPPRSTGPAPSPAPSEPDLGPRVDEILRKISREGMGALTAEERAILDEASRRYSGRHQRPVATESSSQDAPTQPRRLG